VHNLQLRKDTHSHNTRNQNRIDVSYQRLTKSLESYEILGLRLLNKLPYNMINEPINKFKTQLHNWLVSTPFYTVQEFFEYKI
jgi:hypothetical protein